MHPVQNKLSAAMQKQAVISNEELICQQSSAAMQKQAVISNEELICRQSVSSNAEASCQYPKQQGGPIPHKNLAQTSDGPPSL